jgi:hypothetical protein
MSAKIWQSVTVNKHGHVATPVGFCDKIASNTAMRSGAHCSCIAAAPQPHLLTALQRPLLQHEEAQVSSSQTLIDIAQFLAQALLLLLLLGSCGYQGPPGQVLAGQQQSELEQGSCC